MLPSSRHLEQDSVGTGKGLYSVHSREDDFFFWSLNENWRV